MKVELKLKLKRSEADRSMRSNMVSEARWLAVTTITLTTLSAAISISISGSNYLFLFFNLKLSLTHSLSCIQLFCSLHIQP